MHDTSSSLSIVLGSRNGGKIRELSGMLVSHEITVLGLTDFPDAPDVTEDGTTFAENAAKKARELSQTLSQWVLADDSGLAVDALKGSPGVYSARYSGEDATDEQNNVKLLSELADVPSPERTARFICNIAVADPGGTVRLQVEACCRGRIAESPRGESGFGYDPCFLVPEYHRTLAELGPSVKQAISHRARAFRQVIPTTGDAATNSEARFVVEVDEIEWRS